MGAPTRAWSPPRSRDVPTCRRQLPRSCRRAPSPPRDRPRTLPRHVPTDAAPTNTALGVHRRGAQTMRLAIVGLAMVLVGAAAMFVARRRRRARAFVSDRDVYVAGCTGNHSVPPISWGTQQFTGAGQPL